jgi:hypothetical protein
MISRSKCRPSNIPSNLFRLLITGYQINPIATLTDPPSLFAPEPRIPCPELLADARLRRYRELVEKRWNAVPPLAPSNESRRSSEPLRMRLEKAMGSLAEHDGDIDALIRIRLKDVSGHTMRAVPCRY